MDVTAATSLSSVTKPWHLKMEVTIAESNGAAQQGTVETWHAGPESRTTVSFGNAVTTDIEHNDEHYHVQQGASVPQIAHDLLDFVLHPGPEMTQLTGTNPELRTQSFGKVSLACIMLSRPMAPRAGSLPPVVPLGLFPTYCMTPQNDHLQLVYSFGNPVIQRTGFGKFAGLDVTTDAVMTEGSTSRATEKVIALSTYVPTDGEFTPPADAKPVGAHIPGVSGGVIAGAKIGGAVPIYPQSAKDGHISGTVVLRAVIGTDGHIQHLNVMSTGDPDLAIAALQAVRTWTYKPYLLNGEPTSIDTTITVHFNIS